MDFINLFFERFSKDFTKLILLLVIVIIGVFFYPIFDNHFQYLNRLEKRVAVLKSLSDFHPFAENNISVLQKEYEDIVKKLTDYNPTIESTLKDYFAVKSYKSTNNQIIWKIITGGIIWILIMVLFISIGAFKLNRVTIIRGRENFYYQILYKIKGISGTQITMISLLILGCVIGYVIPLFEIVSINYVLLPVFELLIFLIINKIYQSAKTGYNDQSSVDKGSIRP